MFIYSNFPKVSDLNFVNTTFITAEFIGGVLNPITTILLIFKTKQNLNNQYYAKENFELLEAL